MKFVLSFLLLIAVGLILAEDTPGFFLKTTKHIPRLGKRNNLLTKNVPRLGRRSGPNTFDDLKFYNHVQPFDSKFVLDFLSDELFIGEGDLKFVSWNDFDKALESDTELKRKLTSISRDKEIEELKKLMYNADENDNEVYGHPIMYNDHKNSKSYQQFVPYQGRADSRYNNVENDIYYYQNNDVKRGGIKE